MTLDDQICIDTIVFYIYTFLHLKRFVGFSSNRVYPMLICSGKCWNFHIFLYKNKEDAEMKFSYIFIQKKDAEKFKTTKNLSQI